MKITYYFAFCCIFFVLACGRPSYLKSNQYLLDSNTVKLKKQKYKIQEDKDLVLYDLSTVVIQKPNAKVLGMKPRLFFYTTFKNDTLRSVQKLIKKGKKKGEHKTVIKNRFRHWIKTKLGEVPHLVDSVLTERTAKSMRFLLNHKGYYDAKVSYTIKYKRYKAQVIYEAETGERMLIERPEFYSQDTAIQRILLEESANTYLKKNEPIDKTLFEKEKNRLTLAIRNRGYEKFTWNYIAFEADTANAQDVKPQKQKLFKPLEQGEQRAVLYVNILPYSDTLPNHPRYVIRNVYIAPEDVFLQPHQTRIIKRDTAYMIQNGFKLRADSSLNSMQGRDSLLHYILKKKGSRFIMRPTILSNAIQIYNNRFYKYDASTLTLQRITELDVFKFPRIEYVPSSSKKPDELDCIIKMRPSPKQVVGFNFEFSNYTNSLTTSNSNIGSSLNLNYRNRNLFKGAEVFSINAEIGSVFRLNVDSTTASDPKSSWADKFISLLDINTETSLYFPRFIGPNILSRIMSNPHTKFSIGARYLKQGNNFSISTVYMKLFSYDWKLRNKIQHQFTWNPLSLYITLQPFLSDLFKTKLSNTNPALFATLSDKFIIPSMDFSYVYTSPERRGKSSIYFKGFAETAGNILFGIDKLVKPNSSFKIFTLDYSQYIKLDLDFRYSFYISRKQSIVSRVMFGGALPYGNSEKVPFTRRFFLGGPSSMRAWQIRSIGPGKVEPADGIAFQLGDIRLEMNVEYRFKFNSWIAGALFVDAGNVWLWKASTFNLIPPLRPKETGVFTSNFYKQLAVGTGFGLRLDFSFFVLRLDYGIQLYNPGGYGLQANGETKSWNIPFQLNRNPTTNAIKWLQPISHSNWVLAVGYPF